ncbi:hypothetical protein RRG08_006797 [Elysia crispata]|uniref:Uncharacterized protein n=1 Tax=Elysia crispata TaxID=231223 RepID=A0AAE1B0H4_9GAST|nr:hypothetical protein RRG08_006797 [Elysia crispata]
MGTGKTKVMERMEGLKTGQRDYGEAMKRYGNREDKSNGEDGGLKDGTERLWGGNEEIWEDKSNGVDRGLKEGAERLCGGNEAIWEDKSYGEDGGLKEGTQTLWEWEIS